MFLKILHACSILLSERMFLLTKEGGICMYSDDYKKIIEEMLEKLNDLDMRFLRQIYTIIKHYLEKRGR